jgi:hypothetical protein
MRKIGLFMTCSQGIAGFIVDHVAGSGASVDLALSLLQEAG